MSQDDLRSADKWSPGLHRRLLGVPFHLRPSKHDARGKGNEIEDAALLIVRVNVDSTKSSFCLS